MKVIFHVDFDYFYAQIEERDNPNLKGKPVLVCVYSGRSPDSGVVATANYEARKYGVKSGEPIILAKNKLKNTPAFFLPVRKNYYNFISDEVMGILKSYAGFFQQTSIDEAYMDVTRRVKSDFSNAYNYAKQIQNEVFRRTRLTCSIGISINKLLAKIASGVKKPKGITVIKPEEIYAFLEPLPINAIPGIGVKTSMKLKQLGYNTIGDLRKISLRELTEIFGSKLGVFIYNSARGVDTSPVKEKEAPGQFSKIKTLKEDSLNPDILYENLKPLMREIDDKLKKYNFKFKSFAVIFITTNLKTYTRSKTHIIPQKSIQEIKLEVKKLIKDFLNTEQSLIRRIGLKVYNFESDKSEQQTTLQLFIKKFNNSI
ncbi:MAG: DNA polymerase IV [Candidatus Odinarchaeia archaeon]